MIGADQPHQNRRGLISFWPGPASSPTWTTARAIQTFFGHLPLWLTIFSQFTISCFCIRTNTPKFFGFCFFHRTTCENPVLLQRRARSSSVQEAAQSLTTFSQSKLKGLSWVLFKMPDVSGSFWKSVVEWLSVSTLHVLAHLQILPGCYTGLGEALFDSLE